MLPFWVGSVTLAALMGLLGTEKPLWSSWPGEQAVLEGWLILFCRTWACIKGQSLQTAGIVGNAEIGFCFALVCCVTPPASPLAWPTAIASLVRCLHPPQLTFPRRKRSQMV